jgi:hypothetical protein
VALVLKVTFLAVDEEAKACVLEEGSVIVR